MKVFSKIRWAASVLLVFIIVLTTNLIDRDNYNNLSYAVTTMYEDRIVASDLLFEMLRVMQKKEIAFITDDTSFLENQNSIYNQELTLFVEKYNKTKLTDQESLVFGHLQKELETLWKKEASNASLQNGEALKSIEKIEQHLYDLSKIQVQEGQRQFFISNKAKDTINLFTQGEIILLIVMAIIVQVIILYKPEELQQLSDPSNDTSNA